MEERIIDTGLKTYSFNGKCEVSFNPSDWFFCEKVTGCFDYLISKQEEIEAALKNVKDLKSFFKTMRELDADMREQIDALFDAPVCKQLFGDMNLYAFANGTTVWANFLFAIWDEFDENLTRESKTKNPKIEKYLAKYRKDNK